MRKILLLAALGAALTTASAAPGEEPDDYRVEMDAHVAHAGTRAGDGRFAVLCGRGAAVGCMLTLDVDRVPAINGESYRLTVSVDAGTPVEVAGIGFADTRRGGAEGENSRIGFSLPEDMARTLHGARALRITVSGPASEPATTIFSLVGLPAALSRLSARSTRSGGIGQSEPAPTRRVAARRWD